MHEYKLYTAEILKDLQSRLSGAFDGNIEVFVGNRPTSSKKQRDEMIVVSMPYGITDKGVVQTSYYDVEIIVKNTNEGLQKIGRLDTLSKQLVTLFPIDGLDGRYIAHAPRLVFTGNDKLGYCAWNMRGSIVINCTDGYAIS